LSEVSFEDILSVRNNSNGFNRFRECLSEGISLIESDGNDFDASLRDAVKGTLENGSAACEQELSKSSFLSQCVKQRDGFAIGGLVAFAAGDPTAGVVTGAASSVLVGLKDYILGYRGRATNQALARHYAVWDDL
jgi:hypothetical protein